MIVDRRLAALALALALALVTICAAEDRTLDDCDGLVRDRPDEWSSYRCYTEVASVTSRADAVRRLDALLQIHPERNIARFFVADLLATMNDQRGLDRFRDLAQRCVDENDPGLEARTRKQWAYHLTQRGLFEEAESQLALAEAAATESEDDLVLSDVLYQQGWTSLRQGVYDRANALFHRSRQLLGAEGPLEERAKLFNSLGAVAWLTGKFGVSVGHYREALRLYREVGDRTSALKALGNLLGVAEAERKAGRMEPEELREIAEELLAASSEHDTTARCRAHSVLGWLSEGQEARRHFLAAVDVARRADHAFALRGALREAGAGLVSLDPRDAREGLELLEEARDLSRRLGSHGEMVRMLDFTAKARMLAGPRRIAIEESLAQLETIEKLRDLQRDDRVRAGTLAAWVYTYRRLVGYLLEEPGSAEDRLLAFQTLERMRSRVLLDRLDAAGASQPLAPTGPAAERRTGILEQIAQVQRRLTDASLAPAERTEWLDELARLEQEEADVRDELTRNDPRSAALLRPVYPTPDEARSLLKDDEALLSFQWSRTGAAWAVVLTREEFRVFRLPDAGANLPSEIDLLLGLIERRDDSEADWAARLGSKLLGPILRDLPQRVTRLHVIPDVELWRMPFDALRIGPESEPVGATYRISLSPSITLWTRWRESGPSSPKIPVLSLADPVAPGEDARASAERAWTLAEGVRVGPLPRARVEGREFVRRLAGSSVLRLGEQASESFLKTADLSGYSILHFATHALVDATHPDRSAVLLAPGSEEQDGLLQPREIVELDLDGQVVLLSACRSAGGSVVAGEGPLSLARAFFQAGAHGVIGSLWPMRDADASLLVSALSEALASGENLESSLFLARTEMLRNGAPAEAWAGFVLIGNGELVPVPGGRSPNQWGLGLAILVLVGVALALSLGKLRGARGGR